MSEFNQNGVQQIADAPERKQTVTYVDNVSVSNRYVNNEYTRPAQPVHQSVIPQQPAAAPAPAVQPQVQPQVAAPAPAAQSQVQPQAAAPAPAVQPQVQQQAPAPTPAAQPQATPAPAVQPQVQQQAAAPTPVVQPQARPYEASPIQAQARPYEASPVQATAQPQATPTPAPAVQPQAAAPAPAVQPQVQPQAAAPTPVVQPQARPYEASPVQATTQSPTPAPQPVKTQTAPAQNNKEEKKEKKKPPFILRLLAAAAFGLVFGLVAGGVILLMVNLIPNKLNINNNPPASTGTPTSEITSTEPVSGVTTSEGDAGVLVGEGGDILNVTEVTGDMTVPEVAKECMPAIVIINTRMDYNYYGYVQEVTASGTGVIIGVNDEDLFIATNYHVVENSKEINIQFCDSSTANAEIKGKKVSTDLAVVTVKLSSLGDATRKSIKLAKVGDSDALVVGESVVAIGNALGYGQSVTVGVVSALNREVTTEKGETGVFIQTDAAINHGNSGGALLNMRGELIGINSNKLDGSSVESMGYAIPVNTARPIIESLIEKKALEELPEEEQSYIGVSGATVKSGLTTQNGQPIPSGIYVTGVAPGSPAEQAGIQRGDIITEFDGDSIVSTGELQTYLASYPSGAEVTITYKRLENGVFVVHETTVTLKGKAGVSSGNP